MNVGVYIGDASPEGFKPIVQMQVVPARSWLAPVLAGGRVYCKNIKGDLACIGVK